MFQLPLPDDLLDIRRVGDHGDDDLRAGGDLGRRARHHRPPRRQFGGLRDGAIVDRQRMAALQDVSRHRTTHDPQSDEPDRCLVRLRHDSTSPTRFSLTMDSTISPSGLVPSTAKPSSS